MYICNIYKYIHIYRYTDIYIYMSGIRVKPVVYCITVVKDYSNSVSNAGGGGEFKNVIDSCINVSKVTESLVKASEASQAALLQRRWLIIIQ